MKKFKVEVKKKPKSRKALLGTIIAIIMVSSVFGVFFSGFNQTVTETEYNGFVFTQDARGVILDYEGKELVFASYPSAVDSIPLPGFVVDKLRSARVLTIAYDANNTDADALGYAQYLLEQNLQKGLNRFPQRALVNNSAYPQFVEATCENATAAVPVIILETAEEADYRLENNHCIRIQGLSGIDTVGRAERLLYTLLGVIA